MLRKTVLQLLKLFQIGIGITLGFGLLRRGGRLLGNGHFGPGGFLDHPVQKGVVVGKTLVVQVHGLVEVEALLIDDKTIGVVSVQLFDTGVNAIMDVLLLVRMVNVVG